MQRVCVCVYIYMLFPSARDLVTCLGRCVTGRADQAAMEVSLAMINCFYIYLAVGSRAVYILLCVFF